MKFAFLGLLWAVPFYFAGLFGGMWLLPLLSGNTHDGSVEAVMTGAFVFGPLVALAGFAAGFLYHRSKARPRRG